MDADGDFLEAVVTELEFLPNHLTEAVDLIRSETKTVLERTGGPIRVG